MGKEKNMEDESAPAHSTFNSPYLLPFHYRRRLSSSIPIGWSATSSGGDGGQRNQSRRIDNLNRQYFIVGVVEFVPDDVDNLSSLIFYEGMDSQGNPSFTTLLEEGSKFGSQYFEPSYLSQFGLESQDQPGCCIERPPVTKKAQQID
ncbi:hypothetical protein Dimus_031522, partial [Dionaea muscipula]